jgi:hypothetical protein
MQRFVLHYYFLQPIEPRKIFESVASQRFQKSFWVLIQRKAL